VLVTISSIIAVPVAIYFMSGWLKNYSYHVTLSWEIFGAAVAGAVIITIATVSYQVLKAAFTDPVKSLRTE
jgi:ABC-type antimicrobial peptide transport system permease subunit